MARKPDSAVLEGKVRDVAQGGDAVVETERGIVFTRGALPGERVQLKLTGKVAGAQRGQLLALLERSPERVTAPCPVVDRCGGCPLMALAEPAQARLKLAHLRHVLERLGCALEPEWVASPDALGYRARARLGFRRAGNAAQFGYRAAGSHALVDIAQCLVLAPALQAGLTRIREQLAPLLAGEGELMLGIGAGGGCVAELMALRPQAPALYAAAGALVEQGALAGFALRAGGPDLAPALFGDPRQVGQGPDGAALWAEAAGFTQVNPGLNALLVARVLALAEPRAAKVLELFAGHGNFTIGLAAEAEELVAIEADRKAAEACRENLQARGLQRARVVCADAAAIPGRGAFDVVVLDPPRSGARAALPALLARRPQRIVYVSCDLASLRRDLGELLAAGYRADAAAGFDMFPQTSHLEAVVRLVRHT